MPSITLTSVLLNSTNAAVGYKSRQLAVYNTSRESEGAQTGGVCCCWIVPSGTNWVTFEMWGAGGDGNGACCCTGEYRSSHPGTYGKKTYNSSLSAYYTVCAAGSGCCSCCCISGCGFPSYVLSSTGTTVACAQGGFGGCGLCWHIGCTPCTGQCTCAQNAATSAGCLGLADLFVAGLATTDHVMNFCNSGNYQYITGSASKLQMNLRHSGDQCGVGNTQSGCNNYFQQSTNWPGGGGSGATACGGGCCWSGWGFSGLVLITYG
jgi:hypothetical protein